MNTKNPYNTKNRLDPQTQKPGSRSRRQRDQKGSIKKGASWS
jgi:hypothetical protein